MTYNVFSGTLNPTHSPVGCIRPWWSRTEEQRAFL